MDKKYSAQSKIMLAVLLMIVTVSVAGCGTSTMTNNDGALNTTTAGEVVNSGQQSTSTETITPVASGYKDGTYSAVGTYNSPAGLDELGVKLTLKDSIITDATVEPKAKSPMSIRYQQMFNENYKQFVVGKKISDVTLSKVSGSSLTPKGFNDAVNKIKTQAQS